MRCRRSAAVSGTLFQGGTFLVLPREEGKECPPAAGIECPAPAPSGKECHTHTTHKSASQVIFIEAL